MSKDAVGRPRTVATDSLPAFRAPPPSPGGKWKRKRQFRRRRYARVGTYCGIEATRFVAAAAMGEASGSIAHKGGNAPESDTGFPPCARQARYRGIKRRSALQRPL
jgi:hypothetical protein